MQLKVFIFIWAIVSIIAMAEGNSSENNRSTVFANKQVQVDSNYFKKNEIDTLLFQINEVNKALSENNIWSKIYSNYHTYEELKQQEKRLQKSIESLVNKPILTEDEAVHLKQEKKHQSVIQGKLALLHEYEKDPFKKFLTPPSIEEVPSLGNPIAIIGALSYEKRLNSDKEEYNDRFESLHQIMLKLKIKEELLKKLLQHKIEKKKYIQAYIDTQNQIKTFEPVIDIFKTTNNIYRKKIDEIKLNLKSEIKREMSKAFSISAIILFFILFLFTVKYFVRKYMSDNERFYTINKALNITFIILTLFTLLLAYIENVSYLVTILGFASAGIAIAMKDWFMSLMGWFTIIIGGSIHVGDRVKFVRDGVEYVGDIVDISILRMTMHEDITLTTTITNRRAGRIIFIPNNFIFTDMISNYSHAGLKTVWDGIDFIITFDSDIHKATQISKEIVKKYSKGYTDITRKQLNKLRSKYSMKNTNVEPRVFTFIEPHGMKISAWYLTNAYATLTLRSTISAEIIARIQAEENIHLAFPTQSIYVDKDVRKPIPEIGEIAMAEETF